jgi:hypothetical protein
MPAHLQCRQTSVTYYNTLHAQLWQKPFKEEYILNVIRHQKKMLYKLMKTELIETN